MQTAYWKSLIIDNLSGAVTVHWSLPVETKYLFSGVTYRICLFATTLVTIHSLPFHNPLRPSTLLHILLEDVSYLYINLQIQLLDHHIFMTGGTSGCGGCQSNHLAALHVPDETIQIHSIFIASSLPLTAVPDYTASQYNQLPPLPDVVLGTHRRTRVHNHLRLVLTPHIPLEKTSSRLLRLLPIQLLYCLQLFSILTI